MFLSRFESGEIYGTRLYTFLIIAVSSTLILFLSQRMCNCLGYLEHDAILYIPLLVDIRQLVSICMSLWWRTPCAFMIYNHAEVWWEIRYMPLHFQHHCMHYPLSVSSPNNGWLKKVGQGWHFVDICIMTLHLTDAIEHEAHDSTIALQQTIEMCSYVSTLKSIVYYIYLWFNGPLCFMHSKPDRHVHAVYWILSLDTKWVNTNTTCYYFKKDNAQWRDIAVVITINIST